MSGRPRREPSSARRPKKGRFQEMATDDRAKSVIGRISEKQARSIKHQLTSPSCRWPKMSRTSSSKTRRTTRRSCPISLAELSSPDGATSSSSEESNGQDASGHRDSPERHQGRTKRALLHQCRSRQSARRRKLRRPPGMHRRLSYPPRLRDPQRTGLSPLRPSRRPVAVPSRQPALRAHLDRRHHKPRFWRVPERVRRSEG